MILSKISRSCPTPEAPPGLPKAAILTHRNMIALQAQILSFWPLFEEGKEVGMAFLPFFHIYGQVVVMLGGLAQGSTLVLFTTPGHR